MKSLERQLSDIKNLNLLWKIVWVFPLISLIQFSANYHLKTKYFKRSPLALMKNWQIITWQTIDSRKIFPNLKRKNIWKFSRSSTCLYVLIPPGVLITSTSLNAQLMVALFIFLLGERKKLKALAIQYCTMIAKTTSIITREKIQKKNSSLLSWKILPKGVTVSLSHHRRKRH